MVLMRIHRRAASVPVDEPSFADDADFLAAKNSYLFSRAAIDNADALSTASKRNDQQFLRDISAKISSAPYSQPAARPIRRSHVHSTGSPSVTRRRSIAVSSVLRPPLVTDTTDADVDYEVKLIAPITNRLTKYGRATSVPPLSGGVLHPLVIGRRAVIYDTDSGYNHPQSHVILTGDEPEFYHTEIYNQPSVTTQSFQKLNPVADLAVRQAHRNLDRIEREIKSSGDVIITRPISPRTIAYTASRDGPWRRSLSYHGPRSTIVRTRSASPVGRAPASTPSRRYVRTTYAKTGTPVLSDEELFDYLPPAKLDRDIKTDLLLAGTNADLYAARNYYPLPYAAVPSSIRLPAGRSSGLTNVLLYDLHLNSPGDLARIPVTTSSGISKKVIAGSTPFVIHSATPHSFSHHTLSSIPYASTVPTTFTHIHPKPPAAPLQSIPSGLPPVVRPKVSDTRRKVRDVLCKVKGDPHYFDY